MTKKKELKQKICQLREQLKYSNQLVRDKEKQIDEMRTEISYRRLIAQR